MNRHEMPSKLWVANTGWDENLQWTGASKLERLDCTVYYHEDTYLLDVKAVSEDNQALRREIKNVRDEKETLNKTNDFLYRKNLLLEEQHLIWKSSVLLVDPHPFMKDVPTTIRDEKPLPIPNVKDVTDLLDMLDKYKKERNKLARAVIDSIGTYNRENADLAIKVLEEDHDTYNADQRAERVIQLMSEMTAEERTEIISHFCSGCGTPDTRCQCWNDD